MCPGDLLNRDFTLDFLPSAARISSSGGSALNFSFISAPPLKSIPYVGPPCIARLISPAAVKIKEAIMNGHFLPRKS